MAENNDEQATICARVVGAVFQMREVLVSLILYYIWTTIP
jgi:hypothetical protein